MSRRLWALGMRSRSRNGERVSGQTDHLKLLSEAHPLKSVLRHLEDESQMWQLKDRRRQKKRPQNEQENEVEDAEEAVEQNVASDMDSAGSDSTPKFIKQSDFY